MLNNPKTPEKKSSPSRDRLRCFSGVSRRYLGLFLGTCVAANGFQFTLFQRSALAAPSVDLSVVNSFPVTTADPGQVVPYQIVLTNTTGNDATITAPLSHTLATTPGFLVFDSSTASVNDCGLDFAVNLGVPKTSAGILTINSGVIPDGGSCTLTLDVKGFTSGPHVARILAGELITDQGENAQSTSATLSISDQTPATLTKQFSPTTIPGDGRSVVTVRINNPNTFDLTGASLTDNLPSSSSNQLIVDTRVGASAPTTTCADGSVTMVGSAPNFTGVQLSGATIPAGGFCTMTFPVTQTNGGTYTNTIPVDSLTTDNLISNSNAPSRVLSVQTQITLLKAMAATELNEGESTQLTIDISNGGAALTDVVLTDNLPAPLVVADVPNASTTCTDTGNSLPLTVTPTANSFTLNNGNVVGGDAQVPASDASTNSLGACSIELTVTADPGLIGNVTDEGITATNTLPKDALTSAEGRSNEEPTSDDVLILPALVVTKSYSNSNAISPGSTARLTLTIANNSSVETATGVGFTDTFPGDLVIATPANISQNNCGAGVVTAASGSNSISLAGGTINTNDICSIEVDVLAPLGTTQTSYDNVIPHDDIINNEGLDSDGVVLLEGQLSVIPRIEVVKLFDADVVRRGLPSTLVLEIRNNRRELAGVAQPLTGVEITDALPPNLQIASVPNFSHTGCDFSSTPVFTGTTAGSTNLTMTNGSIAPVDDTNPLTDTCRIEIDVIEIDLNFFSAGNSTPRQYTNTTSGFTNLENESVGLVATDVLTVISSLDGEKVFQSDKIAANGRSTAVIQLNNSFPFALTGAAFTDVWTQANVEVAPTPNTSTTCVGGAVNVDNSRQVSFSGGTIPSQVGGVLGTCEVRFDVVMDGTGSSTFINTLEPGDATVAEGYDNLDPISGTLERVATDIRIVKEFDITSMVTGDPTTLTITITNPESGIPLTEMGVTDTMPANMRVFSVPNASTTCTSGVVSAISGQNTFSLSDAELDAGQSCTVSVRVTPVDRGNHTNVLPEDIVTSKENVTNPLPAEATITGSPALRPRKTFSPDSIAGGEISRLTLTVINQQTNTESGEALTNLSFTDSFPADLEVANPANETTTCLDGVVVATPGAGTVSMTGATLAPGESCAIELDVTSFYAGSYVNQVDRDDVEATIQASLGGTTITNFQRSSDTLTVTSDLLPPDLVLVKRITAIANNSAQNPNDGTNLTVFIDDSSSSDDDNSKWPVNYLRGEIDAGRVQPGDEIEYTVYFSNVGLGPADSVRICDRLLPGQSFQYGAYNGGTTDLQLQLGDGSGGNVFDLTAANDEAIGVDRAQLISAGMPVPPSCNLQGPNDNGTLVIDITGTSGVPNLTNLPNTTVPGSPNNAYGFLKFVTKVDE